MNMLSSLLNYPMKTIRGTIKAFFVCAIAACCLLSFAVPASALNLTVNDLVSDLNDDDGANGICHTSGGTCTLRAAMQEINGAFGEVNNTITFNLLPGAHTLLLTNDLPTMFRNVTFIGPGSDYGIIDGQGLYRIFTVQSPATSFFVGYLTLRNASGTAGSAVFASTDVSLVVSKVVFEGNRAINGGAVYCQGCEASIIRCRFSGNQASERGGAIYVLSGGYLNDMHDVLFEGNTAGTSGGAIRSLASDIDMREVVFEGNSAMLVGGALEIAVHGGQFIKIADSSFRGNAAVSFGGAVYIFGDGRSVFDGVTFSGNSSGESGGAAAFASPAGYTAMANCTITGNDAGGLGGGIVQSAGTVQLANVTVTENSAGSGTLSCGLACGGGLQGTFSVRNSVIAGNVDFYQPAAPDCQGNINSGGYNLIGDGSHCSLTGGTGDQIGTALSPIDPLLGSLARNGGTTFTHALLAGSAAIDGGNPGGCYWDHDADAASSEMLLSVDQRAAPKPYGGTCDKGSYERTNCDDGVQNNGETGVDCGGGGCAACSCVGADFAATNDTTYASVQGAYNATWDGADIKAREENTGEALVFARPAYITLIGGHDCAFFRPKGMTTVASLTVAAGRLTVENVTIGP